jgi:hypothetical protein
MKKNLSLYEVWKMKRILLSIFVIGLVAGQASAGLYIPTNADIQTFRTVTVSAGDQGTLNSIILKNGTLVYGQDYGYNTPMSGAVGFVGFLNNDDGGQELDTTAYMEITGRVQATQVTGFEMYLQNDDQSTYKMGLVGNGTQGTLAILQTHQGQVFTMNFLTPVDNPVIGFVIEMDRTLNGAPSRGDNWYASAATPVPIPAAFVLGMLGLGVAGVRLRKFV